jgi:hypothetical protein
MMKKWLVLVLIRFKIGGKNQMIFTILTNGIQERKDIHIYRQICKILALEVMKWILSCHIQIFLKRKYVMRLVQVTLVFMDLNLLKNRLNRPSLRWQCIIVKNMLKKIRSWRYVVKCKKNSRVLYLCLVRNGFSSLINNSYKLVVMM